MRVLPNRGADAAVVRALGVLQDLPRAGLGSWPTPIQLHRDLRGRPLWVKRDDLSGLGRGGAKARKIDLLIGHMLANGHDELITLAGNVTNIAFDLLESLDRFAITPSLLILDDPPLPERERERIFAGVRGRIRLLSASRSQAAWTALRAVARARRAGRNALAVLPGGSHPAGVLGNALGFLEMVAQFDAQGLPLPSRVYVTAATGTTLAGFLLAQRLLRASGRPNVRVVGVAAYGGLTAARTRALLTWSTLWLGLPRSVARGPIEIDHSQLRGGFGHFDSAQRALCEQVADGIGIAIDPIFGGKTWAALHGHGQHLHSGPRMPLYWHCGYTPEWAQLGASVNRGR